MIPVKTRVITQTSRLKTCCVVAPHPNPLPVHRTAMTGRGGRTVQHEAAAFRDRNAIVIVSAPVEFPVMAPVSGCSKPPRVQLCWRKHRETDTKCPGEDEAETNPRSKRRVRSAPNPAAHQSEDDKEKQDYRNDDQQEK